MSAQLGLFASLAPSIQGIDKAKALASYSADVIGMSNKVRKPVSCGGDLWVYTGGGGNASNRTAEMYRLCPIAEFDGTVTSYHEKISVWNEGDKYPGDYARNDPNGFYHGMRVQNGSTVYVLCGPKQTLDVSGVRELLDADNEDEPDYEDTDWSEDDE